MDSKTKKATIQIRIDEATKNQATEVLKSIGMDTSTAINVFLRQVIVENGLPFQPKKPYFNQETLEAIREADQMVAEASSHYSSVDDLLENALED